VKNTEAAIILISNGERKSLAAAITEMTRK
jgi:hypothetical protein